MYDIALFIAHMGKLTQYSDQTLQQPRREVEKISRRAPGHKITVYHMHALSPSLIMSVNIAFNA